jgi:anti-sigma B factor antagonist
VSTFSIVCRQSGPLTILDVQGRITLGESSRSLLRVVEELVSAGHTRLLLDVAAVTHLDSSGLGTMLVGYNSLKAQGGSIGLLRAPRHVRELLELSRLTTVFRLFETESEALSLAGAKPAADGTTPSPVESRPEALPD